MRRRLKTQDRLRPWDVGGDVDLSSLRCPLLNKAHLPIGSHLWSDIMGWILPIARKNNVRLHVNGSRSVEQLASAILDIVRLKLGTIKFKRNARVAKLKTTWNLPASVFIVGV
ncbi:hypothetical protein Tco_0443223 [Tanacetum coccineum]